MSCISQTCERLADGSCTEVNVLRELAATAAHHQAAVLDANLDHASHESGLGRTGAVAAEQIGTVVTP